MHIESASILMTGCLWNYRSHQLNAPQSMCVVMSVARADSYLFINDAGT